jgi:hypothetical protein
MMTEIKLQSSKVARSWGLDWDNKFLWKGNKLRKNGKKSCLERGIRTNIILSFLASNLYMANEGDVFNILGLREVKILFHRSSICN